MAKDHSLEVIESQMKNLQAEFNKSHDELADIYCSVSGSMPKVREYLNLERQFLKRNHAVSSQVSSKSNPGQTVMPKAYLRDNGIITWSYLEDLALKKAEDSVEFQVLMQTKGPQEIWNRR